jgi:hypothetical protein
MLYDFPNVQVKCLLCDRPNCARWKGYYTRRLDCPELKFSGEIAVHVGHCSSGRQDFSYFPSFLIPFRRASRAGLKGYYARWRSGGIVRDAIDCFIDPIVDFTLARSTAYSWLYGIIVALRLNHVVLGIPPPAPSSVFVLFDIEPQVVNSCFSSRLHWTSGFQITLIPP